MFLIIIFIFLLPQICFADKVCVRLSDGVPIEYQSGDVEGSILLKNALNAGYNENEVEVKEITAQEYKALADEKLEKPKIEARKDKAKKAKDRIKQKLGLSESEWDDLKEALGE